MTRGIDVAFRIGDPEGAVALVRKLCQSRLIVCAGQNAFAKREIPRKPAELKRHKLITYPTGGAGGNAWTFRKGGAREEVKVRAEVVANDFMTLLSIARSGMGIAAIPEMLARPLIVQGELVELLAGWHLSEHQINFVYPSRRLLSPKVRLFIDFTIQRFAPTAPWYALATSSANAAS